MLIDTRDKMRKFMLKNVNFVDVNITNITISNKCILEKKCFKCFIGNINLFYDDVKPWLVILPKLSRCIKSFENVKCISFMLEEKHKVTVKKYIDMEDKIKDVIKKDFDFETIHNAKYIITKMKSNKDKIKTNFHDDESRMMKYQWKKLHVQFI